MKIVLAFVGPLNSFILNEAECEGLPEGCQVSVKTRCQGAGIAPTGVIINIPGRGDLDAMAALLDEANLKIEAKEAEIEELKETHESEVKKLEAVTAELVEALDELANKLSTPAYPPANVPVPEGEGAMFEGQPASPYLNTADDPYEPGVVTNVGEGRAE